MFAIHRTDPRKSVDIALDTAERWATMFCSEAQSGSCDQATQRALRLYDLAFFLFEMHENVAGQSIDADQYARATFQIEDVRRAWKQDFSDLLPAVRTDAAFDGLQALLTGANRPERALHPVSERWAHSAVSWLQNSAHNAWHDLVWRENFRYGAVNLPADCSTENVTPFLPLIPIRGDDQWT